MLHRNLIQFLNLMNTCPHMNNALSAEVQMWYSWLSSIPVQLAEFNPGTAG